MRILPYTLQGRFLAGLMLAMLGMGIFFALALRTHTRELLASEAREKANLMVAHTTAIQNYVRSTLRPSISRIIGEDDFIIEAMSTSFVTRHILSALSIGDNSFIYRRVAINARNPDYEMTEAERRLAQRFVEEPGLQRIDQLTQQDGVEHMVMARPVRFTRDCMRCHGSPENAPAVLLTMYGERRGFGKKSDELAGLDIISVPMNNSVSAISDSVTIFATWFALGMVVLFIAMQGFFNRLVVHNLRRVAAILQRAFFPKDGEVIMAPLQQEEEIEGMVRSIEAVATHLGNARQQLRDYADKLESMVRDRTADLESVAAARNADVQLFVSLLSGLNHFQEKQSLLQTSLRLIARHFEAKKAFYACGTSGTDHASWPPGTDISAACPALADKLGRPGSLVTLEEPELQPGYWLIPVQAAGHTRGVLGLLWDESAGRPGRKPSLAIAFGRQLGIALDNLEALDALLRQNALLDSLVEGVPDPLLLVEGSGVPILTNTSAGSLARELMREPTEAGAEQISRPRPDAFPDDGRPAHLLQRLELAAPLEAAMQGKVPAERETVLPDGRSFTARIYPLQSQEAVSRRAIIHIHETTAEKNLLLYLRRSEKLAVVGQLAAGIAHEINNPLGVIRCYAELLDGNRATEQERADIQIILRHVDQAQAVLRDLLDFSRPRPSDFGECALEEFLPPLLELFAPKAATARVALVLDLCAPLPVIRTDKGMLEQVLVNLLLNALAAAAPEKGRIVLGASCDMEEKTVAVTVSDNGPGIEENALAKIFDPFYTTKAAGSGTGLGLAVAFGMVREMKGRLEVRNRYADDVRAGVIFSVVLPVTPPAGDSHV